MKTRYLYIPDQYIELEDDNTPADYFGYYDDYIDYEIVETEDN